MDAIQIIFVVLITTCVVQCIDAFFHARTVRKYRAELRSCDRTIDELQCRIVNLGFDVMRARVVIENLETMPLGYGPATSEAERETNELDALWRDEHPALEVWRTGRGRIGQDALPFNVVDLVGNGSND